jgi:hypothetical protein
MDKLLLKVVFLTVLEKFDNPTLAAFNNAIQGFGRVEVGNIAYEQALKGGLIKKDGNTLGLEDLCCASTFEINRRVTAGTFD